MVLTVSNGTEGYKIFRQRALRPTVHKPLPCDPFTLMVHLHCPTLILIPRLMSTEPMEICSGIGLGPL